MSLNNIFLKVFEEADKNSFDKDTPQKKKAEIKSEDDLFEKKDLSDFETVVSHSHPSISANNGPHFLSVSGKKEETVHNLKIYNEADQNSESRSENCLSKSTNDETVYQFDRYCKNGKINESDAERDLSERNILQFQSKTENVISDRKDGFENGGSFEDNLLTDAKAEASSCPKNLYDNDNNIGRGGLISSCELSSNNITHSSGKQELNSLEIEKETSPRSQSDVSEQDENLENGENEVCFQNNSPEYTDRINRYNDSQNRSKEDDETDESNTFDDIQEDCEYNDEEDRTDNERNYVCDYSAAKKGAELAQKIPVFPKRKVIRERMSLLKEKENETQETWTGLLPIMFSRLPQETVQEFFALGEFLYGKLLDGHRVFGFEGTKNEVGCSTLLLGVADELIRKGMSLLLVDAKKGDSNLFSLLHLEPAIHAYSNREVKICSASEFGEYQRNAGQNIPPNQEMSNERVLIRGSIKENLRKVILRKRTENKFRKFFGYRETQIAQPRFYVLSMNQNRNRLDKQTSVVFKQEFQALAQEFDVVLIDSGSCRSKSYNEILTDMTDFCEDGYFLVQDYRSPEKEFVQEMSVRSLEMQIPCLGIIENFV